jgi:hypothetical protein
MLRNNGLRRVQQPTGEVVVARLAPGQSIAKEGARGTRGVKACALRDILLTACCPGCLKNLLGV